MTDGKTTTTRITVHDSDGNVSLVIEKTEGPSQRAEVSLRHPVAIEVSARPQIEGPAEEPVPEVPASAVAEAA